MRLALVRVGNSRGIRIPKAIIEQCDFGDTVDLRVGKNCLVIARDPLPREGWEKAFLAAGPAKDDRILLDGLPANEFDQHEWRW